MPLRIPERPVARFKAWIGADRAASTLAAAVQRVLTWLPRGERLLERDWRQRHRVVVAVLAAHIPFLVVFASATGHGFHQLMAAGILALAAWAAGRRSIGRRGQSAAAILGLLVASAALVHFSGGRIEAHFHYFVVLGLVILYQDWFLFGLAIAFVALNHGVVGTLDPSLVYDHPEAQANSWLWAGIHGAAIAAASAVQMVSWGIHERSRSVHRRLTQALASSGVGILVVDRAGICIEADETAASLLSLPLEQLAGSDITAHFPPAADEADFPEALAEALDTGEPHQLVAHLDGLERWLGLHILASGGRATLLVREITTAVRASHRIAQWEHQYQAVLEGSRDAIVVAGDGVIAYANPASAALFGFDPTGSPAAEFTRRVYSQDSRDRIRMFKAAGGNGDLELEGTGAGGQPIIVQASIAQILFWGKPATLAVIRDLTEARRAGRQEYQGPAGAPVADRSCRPQ